MTTAPTLGQFRETGYEDARNCFAPSEVNPAIADLDAALLDFIGGDRAEFIATRVKADEAFEEPGVDPTAAGLAWCDGWWSGAREHLRTHRSA